jgi:hypothetical protein
MQMASFGRLFYRYRGWNTVVGYRPQLARSGSGFVSALVLPRGNAADSRHLVAMVKEQITNTEVVPAMTSADDGYSSQEVERKCWAGSLGTILPAIKARTKGKPSQYLQGNEPAHLDPDLLLTLIPRAAGRWVGAFGQRQIKPNPF